MLAASTPDITSEIPQYLFALLRLECVDSYSVYFIFFYQGSVCKGNNSISENRLYVCIES